MNDRKYRLPRWLVGCLMGLGLAVLLPSLILAQDDKVNSRLALPHSHLGIDPDGPAYLVGRIGTGGGFSRDNGLFGYGGALVFHPDYASNFLDFLGAWQTGIVLQVDYQEMYRHYYIRSGDLVLRRYLKAVDKSTAAWSPFVGAGIGMSKISYFGGERTATLIGLAPLVEVGMEGTISQRYLVEFRVQYLQFKRRGHDYINWSARFGLGLALPW